jgi:hypothetical protein
MLRAFPQNITMQKRLAIVLVGLCLILFALYIYLLSASVMHVVMRTETDHGVRELRSQISLLEGDFIAAQHEVSQNIAYLKGYEHVSDKVFVDRSQPSLVLNITKKSD